LLRPPPSEFLALLRASFNSLGHLHPRLVMISTLPGLLVFLLVFVCRTKIFSLFHTFPSSLPISRNPTADFFAPTPKQFLRSRGGQPFSFLGSWLLFSLGSQGTHPPYLPRMAKISAFNFETTRGKLFVRIPLTDSSSPPLVYVLAPDCWCPPPFLFPPSPVPVLRVTFRVLFPFQPFWAFDVVVFSKEFLPHGLVSLCSLGVFLFGSHSDFPISSLFGPPGLSIHPLHSCHGFGAFWTGVPVFFISFRPLLFRARHGTHFLTSITFFILPITPARVMDIPLHNCFEPKFQISSPLRLFASRMSPFCIVH